MSVLQIVLWPDPRLSQPCEPVNDSEDIAMLAQDMLDTMYAAPGRGLAGPQIGVMKRIFVMDAGWKEGTATPVVCVNPEILSSSSDTAPAEEGCLSIPDTPVTVTRPVAVRMAWTDETGARIERDLTGFEARCALHELDHLNGTVIFDHMTVDARKQSETIYLETQK